MDTLIPQLLSFPLHPPPAVPLTDAEYDKLIKILVQNLNNISASKLTSDVPGGGDLLDVCLELSYKPYPDAGLSLNFSPYLDTRSFHQHTPISLYSQRPCQ